MAISNLCTSIMRRYSVAGLVLLVPLLLAGCGSDSFDQPQTASDNAQVLGAATNVLVEPETLKAWIDQGLVNGDSTFDEKVVVLDFGSYSGDNAADPQRIAGACRVNNGELASKRVEGLATAFPLVATGEQMDAVIQRLGIDDNTTIVFTTAGPMYFPTRIYWMFSYWGFPKERLKLLDGGNTAFAAAYPELMTTDAPVATASTYSVKDLEADLQSDLRLSIGEMITLVGGLDSTTDVILDARGANNYSGLASSPGYVTGKVDYTVYDGHPEGGEYLSWKELFDADNKFKPAAELRALFSAKGWSADKMTTVYCLSGYSATPLYFALDSILGAPARLYDGSWSQWGQYSDNSAALGELTANSPWATDHYLDLDGGYRYNIDYLNGQTVAGINTIETLQLDAAAVADQPGPFNGDNLADDSDVVPSQVEAADAAYVGSNPTVTFANKLVEPVLIDATQLQTWIDDGLVNAPLGGQRVVILDATDLASFLQGHIDGAQFWDISQHVQERVEGPAPAVNMVLDGPSMDAMIQGHGIDENTTIVITTSKAATYFPSRAYFLLRYYGFPKTHVKVLNGYNGAWSGATSMEYPEVTASTLSVQDIADIQLDTRVSLAELMDAVRDGRGTPIDFRGDKSAAGSTPGVYSEVEGDYGVFEGTLQGGKYHVWKNFNIDYGGGNFTFKDAGTIEGELAASLGVVDLNAYRVGDYSNPVYSYCRTGYIASTGFFVLDGILGLDVMAYDGSWSQWGKMSADASKGGELPAGSEWATDSATYMSVINYNADVTRPKSIESLNPDPELESLLPEDEEANQVESSDADYKTPAEGAAPPAPLDPFTGPSIGC